MIFTPESGPDAKALRERLDVNQHEFWKRAGVTQSGGSRYEAGRSIPRPTCTCLTIAYGSKKESGKAIKGLRNGQ